MSNRITLQGVATVLALALAGCGGTENPPPEGGEACKADSCGAHGTCQEADGQIRCACEQGYSGERCTDCAPGYQDADGNGTCLSDCTTAQLTCGAHGQCSVQGGTALCECQAGYQGATCGECASGFQDRDGNGTCTADCATAGLVCGNHGQCTDVSGAARCECQAGYQGATCGECASGFQDRDGNGTCTADCATAGLSCGAHGQCTDASGTARCACDRGYAENNGVCKPDCATVGLNCGDHGVCVVKDGNALCECMPGYQDHGQTGICQPDCATAALSCGDNATCTDEDGTPRCRCNAGYQDKDGNTTCLPDCPTAALNCGAHGQCMDGNGTAHCECQAGYQGAACAECAAGYQDRDTNGTCTPDCATASLSCGEHAQCTDASGTAMCSCLPGYQDNGATGVCQPDCATAALDCGAHGSCTDRNGPARCECQTGYQGASCAECMNGYQDNNHDGTCLPGCTLSELSCGEHAQCNDQNGTAVCVCLPGYMDILQPGVCVPDCTTATLDCGVHGRCGDDSGAARCECAEGYEGETCAGCAEGYQDNNHDGTCSLDCHHSGLTCRNGHCADENGDAHCVCNNGYHMENGVCVQDGGPCANVPELALTDGVVRGSTANAQNNGTGSCVSNSGKDVIYKVNVVERTRVSFRANGFDTVMYLRRSCTDQQSEVACNDDQPGGGVSALLDLELDAGTFYLFVDGWGSEAGTFDLEVRTFCPPGTIRDPASGKCVDDPCDPNLCNAPHQGQCKPVLPGSFTCECNPGYVPADNGCVVDPNPKGLTCADPILIPIADGIINNTTVGGMSQQKGKCGGNGAERVYTFSLSQAMRVSALMSGYDSLLHLRTSCGDATTEVVCNDDSSGSAAGFTRNLQPGTYFLFADSYDEAGSFQLSMSFRTNPCDEDVCPGTPECVPADDWATYACKCPDSMVPYNDTCVDNPCQPNPCTEQYRTKCVAQLPEQYVCQCNAGFAENEQGECVPDMTAAEWTFMVYMNADNNLEEYGYEDIQEMLAGGTSNNVRVVVLLDSDYRDNGASRDLFLHDGTAEELENFGELDLGRWETLRDFGVRTVQRFPARHYALILWDHGDGWRKSRQSTGLLKGFSNDDHGTMEGISIANGDYAKALTEITAAAGGKLDLIGFDACLMGMWEVAEATAPFAHVLTASEETEPATGHYYTPFMQALVQNPSMTAAELAKLMVETYYAASPSNDTQSAIDLDKLDELDVALSAFADAMAAQPGLFTAINGAVRGATSFSDSDSHDLWHFAANVKSLPSATPEIKTAADGLIDQLRVVILRSLSSESYPKAYGLAIHLPGYNQGLESAYRGEGAIWSRRTTWDDFLEQFAQ